MREAIPSAFDPIFEHSQTGIICLSLEGRVLFANPASESLLGYTPAEIADLHFPELLVADDFDPQLLLDLGAGRLDEFKLECRLRRRDGEVRRALCLATLHRDAAGEPRMVLAMLEDISRLKVAEARLRGALRDSATDLPTEILLRDRLEVALKERHARGQLLAVIIVDLGRLEDASGERCGWHTVPGLTAAAARATTAVVAETDTVARLDGDQLAVLLAGVESPAAAAGQVRRILGALARLLAEDGPRVGIPPCAGVSIAPDHGFESAVLLHRAELAMYRARAAGRSVGIFVSPAPGRRHVFPGPLTFWPACWTALRASCNKLHLNLGASVGATMLAFALGATTAAAVHRVGIDPEAIFDQVVAQVRACERGQPECLDALAGPGSPASPALVRTSLNQGTWPNPPLPSNAAPVATEPRAGDQPRAVLPTIPPVRPTQPAAPAPAASKPRLAPTPSPSRAPSAPPTATPTPRESAKPTPTPTPLPRTPSPRMSAAQPTPSPSPTPTR